MDRTATAADAPAETAPHAPSRGHHRKLVVAALLVVGLIAAVILLPVRTWLVDFLNWTRDLGAWGRVLIAAAYVPACLLFVPGSLLTLGAGFLFGVVEGTIAVSLGSTAGACAAFVVGRRVARDAIAAKMAGNRRFAAIDRAVGESGFRIVLLTRLSPIFPFNLLNYAYGLTSVSFGSYALASWIGMLPGTIMYVSLGAAARSLADIAAGKLETSPMQTALFWAGIVATVLVTIQITRIARKALKDAIPADGADALEDA